MIVSHVILKNWRNFRSVNVSLMQRVFLVGPNACGKSNFLDVFRFLRDIIKPGGGLQYAVSQRGGLSKIRCLAARRSPDVEIEVELSDSGNRKPLWKYAIGIKQQVRGRRQPYLAYEKVWKNGEELLKRPDRDDKKDELRLTQTYLEQIIANEKFREIANFFQSLLYLHLIPQILRHPEVFSGPSIPEDPYGQNFLERVTHTQERTRKSRLKKIGEALRLAVPQLKDLTYTKDENGIPHLESVYQHWRARGAKQREDQFSDGTLRLIGLLWSLFEGDSLLLLEEPELSLNTGIIRHVPSLMYRLQRQRKQQRQIMVSTHSYDLLSDKGIDAQEVLLMNPGKEGTEVLLASTIDEVRCLLEEDISVADAVLPHTVPPNIHQLKLFE